MRLSAWHKAREASVGSREGPLTDLSQRPLFRFAREQIAGRLFRCRYRQLLRGRLKRRIIPVQAPKPKSHRTASARSVGGVRNQQLPSKVRAIFSGLLTRCTSGSRVTTTQEFCITTRKVRIRTNLTHGVCHRTPRDDRSTAQNGYSVPASTAIESIDVYIGCLSIAQSMLNALAPTAQGG